MYSAQYTIYLPHTQLMTENAIYNIDWIITGYSRVFDRTWNISLGHMAEITKEVQHPY